MSNTIQPSYGTQSYSAPAKASESKQNGVQSSRFLDLAAQASWGRTDTLTTGMSGLMGMAGLPASLMMDLSVRATRQVRTGSVEATEATQAPSLETMLKAKYPNVYYHVFDASSGYWRTRNDYPHYLLYQDGDKAKETLENWQPTGANPFYGSIDGRFTAPKEIHALGSVPPGSKAVVIHPKVQERMETDSAYAQEIFAKIDAWFAFDAARNEASMPGSTWDMSQAVAIGEDGNICNACSSSAGGEITCSKSGSDDAESWWDLRMARHAEFMKLAVEKQIQRQMQASDLLSSSAAKSQLAAMLTGGNLREIFGSEIAGIPTETVLAITRAQVWGSGAIF
ncbi:hypothetical protein D1159_06200 [Pseudoflavonifractor sp. 524-17]|uniref:hypothetical protein n=1 Tax=Pseudoflavonifractor sp. 524-17 TaxID=2304577 RepID=UPI00137AEDA5|nr:hypothetical protein [Pseudoflavonifractor sp. 524-17]NCE64187.1 hypothetical protein [Pseudoflavonifractor sp. 524-17]